MSSLLGQSRPADEIVVADAGSTDGTRRLLDELATRHSSLRVIDHPGDRSAGRNAAIRAAVHDRIACIDGGCVAEPDWLENLTEPFDRDATWVAGFYRPAGPSLRSTCMGLVMVYVLEEVRPGQFLPSARSMAFTRAAWQGVGGFPEGVEFAEDSLFDERLLAAGHVPTFAGDAVVRWTPPERFIDLARTGFRWGRWDGITGLSRFYLKRRFLLYFGTSLAVAGALLVWSWAVPLVVLPLAAATARGTRYKYRWATGPGKYLFIPWAHLVFGYAQLTGYVAGRLRRGRKPPTHPGSA